MCAAFSERDPVTRSKSKSTLHRTHRKRRDVCATQSSRDCDTISLRKECLMAWPWGLHPGKRGRHLIQSSLRASKRIGVCPRLPWAVAGLTLGIFRNQPRFVDRIRIGQAPAKAVKGQPDDEPACSLWKCGGPEGGREFGREDRSVIASGSRLRSSMSPQIAEPE